MWAEVWPITPYWLRLKGYEKSFCWRQRWCRSPNAPFQWFPDSVGLAGGMIVGGYGCGAFVLSPLQTAFINPLDYRVNSDGFFTQTDLLERVGSVLNKSRYSKKIETLLRGKTGSIWYLPLLSRYRLKKFWEGIGVLQFRLVVQLSDTNEIMGTCRIGKKFKSCHCRPSHSPLRSRRIDTGFA